MNTRIRGVLAPVLTPFDQSLDADVERFVAHGRWLVENNAGLAIFGTNSEAASLSVDERIFLTDALLEAGVPAAKLMPGTGACSLTDAVTLTKHSVQRGAAGVLMLPPFFFKNVSDDGVFAYYAEVIERVGDDRLSLYLYHIPQFTQVPITLGLIERLLKRYPKTVAGAKDSSGDWGNTEAMLKTFASSGFDVFPASESLMARAMPLGGAGCISATANMNPLGIHSLVARRGEAPSAELQAKADTIRQIFQAVPMIPAMKHALSHFADHSGWATVRPPLTRLEPAIGASVLAQLAQADFDMPGYPQRFGTRSAMGQAA